MIRLHCLSPESESRSGPLSGESAFTLRRLSLEKKLSVNALGIAGDWYVSGEIKYLFANTYVNLLPGKTSFGSAEKCPVSPELRSVLN
jgi:hypothetical protein